MKRGAIIIMLCLAALVVAVVWHLLALPKLHLHYAGLRHDLVEDRWFADLWLTNTLNRPIHCCGYQCRTARGFQSNDSMIDFQCTVGFEENRIQAWPLWFAITLDLKPGEAARLSLDIPRGNAPKRIGVTVAREIRPATKMERSLHRVTNHLPAWLWPPPRHTETVWCPTKLIYPPDLTVTNLTAGANR
jgi:hypothetical protein